MTPYQPVKVVNILVLDAVRDLHVHHVTQLNLGSMYQALTVIVCQGISMLAPNYVLNATINAKPVKYHQQTVYPV
jgi:hypothetical protein